MTSDAFKFCIEFCISFRSGDSRIHLDPNENFDVQPLPEVSQQMLVKGNLTTPWRLHRVMSTPPGALPAEAVPSPGIGEQITHLQERSTEVA